MADMGKESSYQKLQRMMSELPEQIIDEVGVLTPQATQPPANKVAERFFALDQKGRDGEDINPEELMRLRANCVAFGLLSNTFNLDIPWSNKVERALNKRPTTPDGTPDARSRKWRGGFIPCGIGKYSRRNGSGHR